MSTLEDRLAALEAENASLRAALSAAVSKPKAAPRKVKGSHWSAHVGKAWEACKRDVGASPWFVPNAAPWVELATSERSTVGYLGLKVKFNAVCRLPAERYWEPGTFPKVNHVAHEAPRETLTETERLARTRDGIKRSIACAVQREQDKRDAEAREGHTGPLPSNIVQGIRGRILSSYHQDPAFWRLRQMGEFA